MRVEVNLDGVKKKLSKGNIDRGQFSLANQALADMNPYVPFDQDPLRTSGTVEDDGGSLTWNTSYAKAQFYGFVGKGGYPVRRYTTPGTGPRWDLKASSLHMKDWIKAFIEGADL